MTANRLTVLGDSFVEGRGDPRPDGTFRGWVPAFATLLGIPTTSYVNLGTFQATAQDVLDAQLTTALRNKAPLIGVIAGFNDVVLGYDRPRFRRAMGEIFARLAGAATTMFTATYPDIPSRLFPPGERRAVLRNQLADANDVLRTLAARDGVVCLDVARAPGWSDPALWSADGTHPSAVGHRLFAEIMAEAVAEAIGLALVRQLDAPPGRKARNARDGVDGPDDPSLGALGTGRTGHTGSVLDPRRPADTPLTGPVRARTASGGVGTDPARRRVDAAPHVTAS
jgi:lysophospholipase L1-like esterase